MRAIWKGAVSFGLVSVPVKLYAATESHDISFRQVHAKDGGRIKYQRVCSIDGEEVAYADIAKGYETEDGQMVVLDDDDLAELPASSSREISVEKFVPTDQIDPLWLEKSYYLEPDKAAAKPYALLREALKDADRVAVVTVSIRTRMTTAVLRVRDDVIVMQTMLWPDEVRKPDFAGLDATEHAATANELKMAKLLVDTLAGDYDASEYDDDYAKAVEALVQAKLEGGEVKAPEQPKKSTGEVVDLLAALQRSVDAAKTSRGESPGEAPSPRGRRAGREEDRGQEVRGEEGSRQEGREEDDHQEGRREEGQLARDAAAAQREHRERAGDLDELVEVDLLERGVRVGDVAGPVVQGRDAADAGVEPQVAAVDPGRQRRVHAAGRGDGRGHLADQRVVGVGAAAGELAARPGDDRPVLAQPRVLDGDLVDDVLEAGAGQPRVLADLHAEAALGDQPVGHVARPLAGGDHADRERVGHLADEQRVGVAVALGLERRAAPRGSAGTPRTR